MFGVVTKNFWSGEIAPTLPSQALNAGGIFSLFIFLIPNQITYHESPLFCASTSLDYEVSPAEFAESAAGEFADRKVDIGTVTEVGTLAVQNQEESVVERT